MNEKKILVIDDDEKFRGMLQRILEKEGYAVLVAADGREGVECFSHHPVDLVITDLIMPDMEGIETIIQLRAAQPEAKIIAISGGGRRGPEDYLPIAKTLGAQQTFAKPFDLKEFLTAVANLLADPQECIPEDQGFQTA